LPIFARSRKIAIALVLFVGHAKCAADEPLHVRIDGLIAAKATARVVSAAADDAEFARRVYLDLAGRIPTCQEARTFLGESSPDKRTLLIDRLLASVDYARHMQERFHVVLMERLGDNPQWTKYLHDSFAANKPWDQMAREILRADPQNEATRGAAFFYAKRLDHYGQNPIDYPGLTRDVGRLFLGVDLRCAQCHDHLFIEDYKQEDFQGLSAFFQSAYLEDLGLPVVGEKPTTEKTAFMSVFAKVPRQVGPRFPGGQEVAIPAIDKGEEYVQPPDPKTKFPGTLRFSPLSALSDGLPRPDNALFTRNIVNRLWCMMMGRGLVEPLDLSHRGNSPSHPELLELLAGEFVAHGFDVRWLLRELALSQAYQRASILPPGEPPPSELFLTALEKRLSAEQLLRSMLEATGERERLETTDQGKPLAELRERFVKALANAPREPEDAFSPSLASALFVLHDKAFLDLLQPRPGNLIDRLEKLAAADQAAEELYLTVLSRLPTDEERVEVAEYLMRQPDRRAVAISQLAWALLASTEFCVNH